MNSTANNQSDALDPLLRERKVLEVVPIGKSQMWRMIAAGTFPKPLKVSARVTAWRASDIREWLASLSPASTTSKRAAP